MACISLDAQTFVPINKTVFAKETICEIMVEGTPVTVNVTADGNHYIVRTSARTNEPYKTYLGFKTDSTYSYGTTIINETVYSNRERTKFWGLVFTKTGTLKKLELTSTESL